MEEKIKKFCQKWIIKEFSLFGSYLGNDFNKESDVDVLVKFDDNVSYGFFELVDMRDELENIFGRKVDLLTKRGVEQSRNYIRSRNILQNSRVVYAEG